MARTFFKENKVDVFKFWWSYLSWLEKIGLEMSVIG